MKLFRLFGAGLGAAILALSASVYSADLALSGTVYGTDNKPLPDVVVKLAQAGLSTTTDASGAWSLNSTAGIGKFRAVAVGSGRLQVDGGRISIDFSGHDLLGRGQGAQAKALGQSVKAARSAATLDTVSYTWNGNVRLRDTVSLSQTGIVRILDTNINAWVIYGYLTDDRDGQRYRTVTIGGQIWMAQNLNAKVDSSWWYEDDAKNGMRYGRLYTWAAAMGLNDTCNVKLCSSQVAAKHRGACPMNWHVPSNAEWSKLNDTTLGDLAGFKLKASSGQWSMGAGADDYGFSALPAGDRHRGSFYDIGSSTYFWSAFEYKENALYQTINGNTEMLLFSGAKSNGYSLRCLQD